RSASVFLYSTDAAPPDISTLSLHDALPIFDGSTDASRLRTQRKRYPTLSWLSALVSTGKSFTAPGPFVSMQSRTGSPSPPPGPEDRKSTRLNSSHVKISYAVFCLKKKNRIN